MVPYASTPAGTGLAAAGSSPNYSRGDHVHGTPLGFNQISVAGGGNVSLTAPQCMVRNLYLYGTLTANIVVTLLTACGVHDWLIYNVTSGAFTLTLSGTGGGSMVIPQNTSMAVWTDGSAIYQSANSYAGSVTFGSGATMGSTAGSSTSDLSHGLALYSTTYGLCVTSSRLNYVASGSASHVMVCGSTDVGTLNTTGMSLPGTATVTGNATVNGGTLSLNNATSNTVVFATVGAQPPTGTTRSTGTRVVWQSDEQGTNEVDFATGIASYQVWDSVPMNSATYYHAWYGGTVEIATLDGVGDLWLAGTLTPAALGGTIAGAHTLSGAVTFSGTVTVPTQAVGDVSNKATNGSFVAASGALGNMGRNRLMNGTMEVQQRGPSFTPAAAGAYTLDRWIGASSAGTAVFSVASNAGYTSRKQMQIAGSLAVGGTAQIEQRIEAVNCYDWGLQQVTLSFNTAYSISAGATTFTAALYSTATLDTWTTPVLIQSLSFTPTGSAATYPITFAALTAAQAANGLRVVITATQATATGTLAWAITSLQLESGAVATPFERRSYGYELFLCQRYYNGVSFYFGGYQVATGVVGYTTQYPAQMRCAPTCTPTWSTQTNVTGPSWSPSGGGGNGTVTATVTTSGAFVLVGSIISTSDL
jgi:hypothetical protein